MKDIILRKQKNNGELEHKKSKVLYEIVNLRALAIFFVVIGHCIIIYSHSWHRYSSDIEVPVFDYLKAYINIIQMPLYFSISGYLYNISAKKPFAVFIKDKARRLLLPWVFFTFALMLPIRFLVQYPGYSGLSFPKILFYYTLLGKDDGNVWFMSCLFICLVITYLYDLFIERLHVGKFAGKIGIMFIALILLRKEYMFFDYGLLRNPSKYLFYFQLGCLISMFWDFQIRNVFTKIIGALVYAVCSVFGMMMLAHKASIMFVVIRVIMVIALYLMIPSKSSKAIEFLSSYSYGLFLFHSPLIYITFAYLPNAHPAIVVGINLLVFVPLSILLTWIFKHSVLRILIGEK